MILEQRCTADALGPELCAMMRSMLTDQISDRRSRLMSAFQPGRLPPLELRRQRERAQRQPVERVVPHRLYVLVQPRDDGAVVGNPSQETTHDVPEHG